MSSFRDRFGKLTVAQVRELNEAAVRWHSAESGQDD